MINFAGQNLFVHFLVAADVEKEHFFFCDFYRDNDSVGIGEAQGSFPFVDSFQMMEFQ